MEHQTHVRAPGGAAHRSGNFRGPERTAPSSSWCMTRFAASRHSSFGRTANGGSRHHSTAARTAGSCRSRREHLIRTGALVLPSGRTEYGGERELVVDIHSPSCQTTNDVRRRTASYHQLDEGAVLSDLGNFPDLCAAPPGARTCVDVPCEHSTAQSERRKTGRHPHLAHAHVIRNMGIRPREARASFLMRRGWDHAEQCKLSTASPRARAR